MTYQGTLRRSVSCAGIGLHSGNKVHLALKPAPADHGVRFRRTDLDTEIPATVNHIATIHYATGLARGAASVETVEHLLAALVGQGVDNVLVELSHPEVPIMDGSAAPFVYLIQEAGLRKLNTPRKYIKIVRPIEIIRGDKRIAIYPSENRLRVTYTISFDHPLLRQQSRTIDITPDVFAEQLAPARTFGFLKEVEMLRQRGLALGGSLENAIVLGETGALNTLRFEDEFVRHKILDAIGDLALVGYPLLGNLIVERGGHALHTAFAAKIIAQTDAWQLVDAPSATVIPLGSQSPSTAAALAS